MRGPCDGKSAVQRQKLAVPAERAMALAESKDYSQVTQVPSRSNDSSEYVLMYMFNGYSCAKV